MNTEKNKVKKRGIVIAIIIVSLTLGCVSSTPESEKPVPPPISKGEALYQKYCVSCHGEKGVGENPLNIYATDEYGVIAPPLDESAHAWHHTDEALVEVILEGSSRNPRMKSWKDVLTEEDARDLVGYIKSLWSPRIKGCQGPRHMECM